MFVLLRIDIFSKGDLALMNSIKRNYNIDLNQTNDLDKLIDAINRDLQNNLIGVAGTDPTGYYRTSLVEYLQNKIIQINVEKGPGPVYAYQKNVQKRKRGESKDPNKIEVNKKFKFRRSGSSTEEPSPETWESHIHTHWVYKSG